MNKYSLFFGCFVASLLGMVAAGAPLRAQLERPADLEENKLALVNPAANAPGMPAGAQLCEGDATRLLFPLDGTYVPVDFCGDGGTGSGQAQCTGVPPDQHNDDDSATVPLGFSFDLYGDLYTSAFINNNGNISFETFFSTFSAVGFPSSSFRMVAPFWGDVDTGNPGNQIGDVWMKLFDSDNDTNDDTLIVTWDNVGYYNEHGELLSTFQVAISDGTNPDMGLGNNVCFSWDNMCWTTGDASGGSGGFGGTPATVGANRGDGVEFFQIGRFDHEGSDSDGPFGNADGVSFLDFTSTCFNVAVVTNIAPIPQNFPPGNLVTLNACVGDVLALDVRFISPEQGQTVTVAINDVDAAQAAGLAITSDSPAVELVTIGLDWTPGANDVGSYVLEFTATDDFDPPGERRISLRIDVTCGLGACCHRSEFVCLDSMLEDDCQGPQDEWTAGASCANLDPPCARPTVALVDTDLTLMPVDMDLRQDTNGPVSTKAKFDIWNANEVRFSGTRRCITCWDQTLLRNYGAPNHFLIENLQTDVGKARIDGLGSTVCAESVPTPLLGVAVREVSFGAPAQVLMRAAATPIGMGHQSAQILADIITPPGELTGPDSGFAGANTLVHGDKEAADSRVTAQVHGNHRGDISTKGSVLIWPKVEVKWDQNGNLTQDTFIDLSNDFPADVAVQLYFVNGDPPADAVFVGDPPILVERAHPGWNNVDVQIELTNNEPTYWSVLSGLPKGVSPLTVLDPGFPPGRPDSDAPLSGHRRLRGFVVGWAVNKEGKEISWNHLAGAATVINYADATAWEYNAWAFQCVSGVETGEECDGDPGELSLDGVEYEDCPDKLLFNFFASGSQVFSPPIPIRQRFTLRVRTTEVVLGECGPIEVEPESVSDSCRVVIGAQTGSVAGESAEATLVCDGIPAGTDVTLLIPGCDVCWSVPIDNPSCDSSNSIVVRVNEDIVIGLDFD